MCFSWIKADLWWPSDTHLCQLDTFGKTVSKDIPHLFRDCTQFSKQGERDCFPAKGFFLLNVAPFVVGLSPPGWVLMRAETGTNIASPPFRSMLMGCWGSLERTSSSWRKIHRDHQKLMRFQCVKLRTLQHLPYMQNSFDLVSLIWLCRIFGHFSHRSEWQLVKIDFWPIFERRCTSEDYFTWQLHNEV